MSSNQPLQKYMPAIFLFLFGLGVSCAMYSKRTPPNEPLKVIPPGWISTTWPSETDTAVANAIAERIPAIWMKANFTNLIDQLYSPEIISHEIDQDILGTDAFKKHVSSVRTKYPDLIVKTKQLVINKNQIVWHWTSIGTYREASDQALLTGKEVEITGVRIYRILKGKIVEEWAVWNNASVLKQLDYAVTPPTATGRK